jgi:hypothetical protein
MKAELTGHEFDLDALARLLPTGHVRVLAENGSYYLVADAIDNPPEGMTYYEVAPRMLDQVNGLARTADPAYQHVRLTDVYLEGEHRHVTVRPDSVVVRVRVGTPTISVFDADGRQVPQPSSQSLGPRRAAVAAAYPHVAEALAILGQPGPLGWVEAYKVFEIVRDAVKPTKLEQSGLATRYEISAFKASANRPDISGADARHARTSGGTPHRTMKLQEARVFVSELVRKWIDTLG